MEFVELNMKKKYSTLPESMKNMEMYGFNWMEFVISVPSRENTGFIFGRMKTSLLLLIFIKPHLETLWRTMYEELTAQRPKKEEMSSL